MSTDRPHVNDSYADVLTALRLMESGKRADFDTGSRLLSRMGEEANASLVKVARDLLRAVAVLTDQESTKVLDHMVLRNIEQAEGMDDADEQG